MKRVICVSIVAVVAISSVAQAYYASGTHDGYFWSLWYDDQSGYVDYQNGSGGNYSVSWDYSGNFTCGKGWSSGSTTRVVGYNCGVYNHNGGGGVFGYYGWTRNPLREYYVNEMWGTGRPTGTYMGTINSDGGTYDMYRSQRVNAPSIDGTQTFWQIYSTRTSENSTGQNHTITFANHANAWAGTGWGLGSDLSPAAILLTEAYSGSNGYVNATVWSAGSSGGGSPPPSGGGVTGNHKGLINRASGRAMDVYNINNSNGANIVIWDYYGQDNQSWNISSASGGVYNIRSVMSGGRSLDVYNFGTSNGTNIVLWDFWGGDTQRFQFQDVGGGYYRITPVLNTGQCLDAGGTGNGANVQTWSYWGGDNQQWSIVD